MIRDLTAIALFLAVVAWAATGWPWEPTGSVTGFLGLIALTTAGVLVGGDREGGPR